MPPGPAIDLVPGQTEAAEVIELESLQKVIDQKTVIDIEALRVKAREIAALVGPVGSGKDTLFELLTGQSRPTVGEVRLDGIDPYAEKGRFSRQVGGLFIGRQPFVGGRGIQPVEKHAAAEYHNLTVQPAFRREHLLGFPLPDGLVREPLPVGVQGPLHHEDAGQNHQRGPRDLASRHSFGSAELKIGSR